MSIRLYYNKFSRASRVRWMLEELEAPYELVPVDMSKGEHKEDDYFDIHPLGKLPAIMDGDTPIFESSAICLHLTDRFTNRKLAPELGSIERGLYYQWAFYAQVTLEVPVYDYFRNHSKADRNQEAADAVIAKFQELVRPIENTLANGPYLLGDAFSTVDLLNGSILAWGARMGMLEGRDTAKEYVDRIVSRPAFLRSLA